MDEAELEALGLDPADLLEWLEGGGSEPLPWPPHMAILGDPGAAREVAQACARLMWRTGALRRADLGESLEEGGALYVEDAPLLPEARLAELEEAILARRYPDSAVFLAGPAEGMARLLFDRPELSRRILFRARLG